MIEVTSDGSALSGKQASGPLKRKRSDEDDEIEELFTKDQYGVIHLPNN